MNKVLLILSSIATVGISSVAFGYETVELLGKTPDGYRCQVNLQIDGDTVVGFSGQGYITKQTVDQQTKAILASQVYQGTLNLMQENYFNTFSWRRSQEELLPGVRTIVTLQGQKKVGGEWENMATHFVRFDVQGTMANPTKATLQYGISVEGSETFRRDVLNCSLR